MLLNCDLGESYGAWQMGLDAEVMPFIDQASIATGFHAGDPLVIQRTLRLAQTHNVCIGAHPSYPDRVGFGRRSMQLSREQVIADMHYQVAALDGMSQCVGLQLRYVKPHGALYRDMMNNTDLRLTLLTALARYPRPLTLLLQATAAAGQHREEAARAGVSVWFEAFADRCYADDGTLLSRSLDAAVHPREQTLAQVEQLCRQGTVTTVGGRQLPIAADTLCVHGDNPSGVQAIRAIRALLD